MNLIMMQYYIVIDSILHKKSESLLADLARSGGEGWRHNDLN